MNILVTGSAGYIGSSFAYQCLKLGHKVVGIDNYSNSNDQNTKILKQLSDKFIFYGGLSNNEYRNLSKKIKKKKLILLCILQH